MTSQTTHHDHKWAIAHLATELWHRFKEGWRLIPPGGATRYFITLFVGTLIAAAVVSSITLYARSVADQGLQSKDHHALLAIQDDLPITFYQGSEAGTLGGSLLLWPLMIFAAGMAIWFRKPLPAISFVAGYALVSLTVVLGWKLWARSRPDLIHEGILAPGFHSFPSGHVAHIPVAYGLLVWWWMKTSHSNIERFFAALIVPVLVVVVAAARLRTGAHWPSDVVAGAVVGFVWLAILLVALRMGSTPSRVPASNGGA